MDNLFSRFMENAGQARRVLLSLASITVLLMACAPNDPHNSGIEAVGTGVMGLVLSPLMIVAGLAQGLAFLPYTLGTGLEELNKGLIQAQAVSLEDAYRATYGLSITDPRVHPKTGQITGQHFQFGQFRPQAMQDATSAFQGLLMSQGMPEAKARHFILVGDYTQTRAQGQILMAVVYRHPGMAPIRVLSKETGIVSTLRPEHQGWYRAYERDVDGRIIDEVIDWTGLEYKLLQQDKVVALLMVITAESIKTSKRSPDYWAIEKRWNAGESNQIMAVTAQRVRQSLKLN